MSGVPNADRTLLSVAALALFALNEARMFQFLPRQAETATGHVHAVTLQLMGAAEPVYLTMADLGVRWGLVALTVALCAWAVAETFRKNPQRAQ